MTNQTDYNRAFDEAETRLFSVFDGIDSELKAGNISLESEFPEFNLRLAADSLASGLVSLGCEDGLVENARTRTCVACPVGYFYSATSRTCTLCPAGLYQDKEGQFNCAHCPFGMNTTRPGSKSIEDCEEIDECLVNSCQNNGTCVDGKGHFTCICPSGYTGTICSVHDCGVINKCKNNAICVGFESGYNCTCLEEYSGHLCEYKRVHGQFTQWSTWSACSQSCDSGRQYRTRNCSNPTPMYDGRPCQGDNEETRPCNTDPCPVCSPTELRRPIKGTITCNLHADGEHMICTARCISGYGFSSPVPANSTYICGPNVSWVWPHQNSDNKRAIVPDCSLLARTTKSFIWTNVYNSSNCDDASSVKAIEDTIVQTSNHVSQPLNCRQNGACTEPVVSIGCSSSGIRKKRDVQTNNSIVVNVIIQANSTEEGYNNIQSEMNTLAETVDEYIKNGSLSVTINGTTMSASENATYGNFDSCPIGSVLAYDGGFCVLCRTGTFYTQNANKNSQICCVLCDQGYYQPEEGQLKCIQCPAGMTTDERGTANVTDCYTENNITSEMTTSSVNTIESSQSDISTTTIHGITLSQSESTTNGVIQSCPEGSVLEYAGNFCAPCPNGMFYAQNANNNSQITCVLCDQGYYQPEAGQMQCIQCPAEMTTNNRGSKNVTDCFQARTNEKPTPQITMLSNNSTPGLIPESTLHPQHAGLSENVIVIICVVAAVLLLVIAVIIGIKVTRLIRSEKPPTNVHVYEIPEPPRNNIEMENYAPLGNNVERENHASSGTVENIYTDINTSTVTKDLPPKMYFA